MLVDARRCGYLGRELELVEQEEALICPEISHFVS